MSSFHLISMATIVSVLLTGCIQSHSLHAPASKNPSFSSQPGEPGASFIHETAPNRLYSAAIDCSDKQDFAAPVNYRVDKPLTLNSSLLPAQWVTNANREDSTPLSPGDMVEVIIENGDGFAGRYVIDSNGYINVPHLEPISAVGRAPFQVASDIELALIKADIFQAATARVALNVLNWAGIEVSVSGAVFQPGRVTINAKSPSNTLDEQLAATGDYTTKRLLSEALRAASGIRPDAKLDQVILIRKGWQVETDMTGILTGKPVVDYPLVAGDQVIVPSTGCFQQHLVRPSQITPKGFRVFMSNLIDSAMSNSSAAVGRYSSNIPYGTKLLQAAVSANCVGGKIWTNAPRSVLLVSRHPITHETQVIERSVEQLMRFSMRDEINPYLMPDDAIACYDSSVTNLRDVARALSDVIAPFVLL